MNGFATESGNDRTADRDLDRLEAQIRRRLSGRIRSFRLRVREDGVILEGCTPTYYSKQLAQHAVMEATKLPILANEITVS